MRKATKEAKVNTSWINPNEAWDAALSRFVADVLNGVNVFTIGPITTRTAESLGIRVDAQAQVFTAEGLVQAVYHKFHAHS